MPSYLVLFSFLAFIIPNCSPIRDCGEEQPYIPKDISIKDSIVGTVVASITARKFHVSPHFRLNFLKKNSALYASFLTNEGSLVFANLMDSNDIHIAELPFSFIKGNNVIISHFENDTLHLVESQSKIYHRVIVQPGFKLQQTQRIELDKIYRADWLVNVHQTGRMLVVENTLYLPYTLSNTFNFLDSSAFLKIDLDQRNFEKILPWPECYKNCRVPDPAVPFAFKDKQAYYLFANTNQLAHYDPAGKLSQVIIPTNYQFQPFDKKQEKNIAYGRKYELLKETNLSIVPTSAGYAVIRRLARKQITDPMRSEILFYSDTDIYLGSKAIPFSPLWSASYKSGVMLLNDSLTKACFYEPQ